MGDDVTPTSWLPKDTGLGAATAAGDVTPVPDRGIKVGEEVAFEAKDSVAAFAPAVVGANWTLTVHVLLGATLCPPHPSFEMVNMAESVPESVTEETFSAFVPFDVKVTVWAVDVELMAQLPNANEAGLGDTPTAQGSLV